MRFLFLICLFFFAVIVSGNVNGQIIVTSTADSGPGSLREAVTTANVAGGETILFTGIPNPSVIIIDNPITLTSNINLIDGDIDGDGDPDVTLQSLSGNSTGLIIEGANNTVQNLHMENFGGLGNAAIRLTGVLAIGNTILGCYLGTDITGLLASTVAGNEDGLQVTAGASGNFIGNGTVAGRNIFSGNISNGLTISNSNNSSVQGNYIGLASDGNTIIPNLNMGVAISGTSTNNTIGGDNGSGEGNVISGNGSSGIDMVVDVNFIFGNYIGLDATGTQARGNVGVGILINGDNNEIGDNIPGYGNVISANDAGIEQVGGSGTLIEGNIVGLDATGTSPLGNLTEGVSIVGTSSNVSIGDGTISGANYISGNTTDGIKIAANGVTSIVVDFNFIGTGIDGVTQIGNGGHGVSFAGNTDGNSILNSVITSSGLNGINATGGSDDNFFTQNSIYNNAGDGISLGGAPSAPTIDAIDGAGVITGTGVAGNTIEIYLDADDEGQYYLGSTIVDGLGNWTFAANLSNFPSGVLNINATQFDGFFTSEFSAAPLFLGATFPPFVVVNTDDTGVGSLRWAIGNANADPDINTIIFNIPSSDPGYNAVTERWTIAPLTNTEEITETVIIDATTQNPFPPASTAEYRVILDGAPNALNYGLQTSAPNVEFYGFHFTGFDLNSSSAGISVTLDGAGTIIGDVNKGNIFNANSNGIYVALADNNVIKGNLVGTDYSGTISIPNNNGIHFASGSNTNIVGGPLAGEENLISGNTTSGIIFNAGGTNTVENNLIGTDITGLLSLGNGDGIRFTASNDNTIQDNTISGNTGNGIFLGPSSNNFFYGNNIGIGTDGSTPLSNNIGILGSGTPTTDVDNNTIGGTGAGEPNIIAHNTNEGISITFLDMEFNTFIANQIFLNGGKGIDLGTDGNDGKTPPIITAIGTGTVSGTGIDGDIIHVYRDNTGSNPLQGAEYLGSTTVVGGVWTVLEGSIIPADLMNATATDGANNTSEFAILFPEPEIAVFQGIDNSGIPITDGQVAAVDFGSALIGNDIDLIFAVENTGTGILDITNLTITGDAEFSVLTPLPPTINAGQTVNFEIRLSGAAAGTFNATITIDNSDADEAAFDFPITGTITIPEIEVFQGVDNSGIPIIDGQVAAVDFGSALIGNDIDLTFAVENTGTGILDITNLIITGDAEFSVLTPLPPTINAGQTVNFEIRLSGAAAGTFNATITIDNSDADEAAFDFPITGTITQPEIEVFQGIDNTGTPITDGQVAAVDFGSALVGNDIDLTFAVENTGTGILDITNLTITGDAEFSVLTPLPPTINAGQTVNFEIRLSGAAAGTFNATINIDNSDADEAVFDFPITGIITIPPGPEIELYLGVDNTGTPIINGQFSPIDFGTAPIGNSTTLTFAIENIGSNSLNISSITSNGVTFSATALAPTAVSPGATVIFDLIMDGSVSGTFNEIITIVNDDPDENTFVFPVTGIITAPEIEIYFGSDNTGTPIISNQVIPIDFGSSPIGSNISQTFAIENIGNEILSLSSISVGGTDFTVLNQPVSVDIGATVTFQVQLSGTNDGAFNDAVTIQSDDPDETLFIFPITGDIVKPEIEVYRGSDNTGTPIINNITTIEFGSRLIGNDIDLTFAIENVGTSDLTISSISSDGSKFSIITPIVSPISPNITETFIIRLDGSVEGTYAETITISNNDSDEAIFTYSVTGNITLTIEPEISVFQGIDNTGVPIANGELLSIDIGQTTVGNAITQFFAIENVGTDILTISSISITGTDFIILSAPASVPVGGTELFEIEFIGFSEGSYTEDLSIQSDDTDESVFQFPITASIFSPQINLYKGVDNTGNPIIHSETTVEFGSVEVSGIIDQTFAIENSGSGNLEITEIITGTKFIQIGAINSPISPGSTETFVLRFDGTEEGSFSEQVRIESNDPVNSSFTFFAQGAVTCCPEPEIIVYFGSADSGILLADNQLAEVDLGITPAGIPLSQTFTIQNLGTAVLNISEILVTEVEFSILSAPISVAIGSTETFQVELYGINVGSFSGIVVIQNDDFSESTFNFPIRGTIESTASPEISIYVGADNSGVGLTNGQVTVVDFGFSPRNVDLHQTFSIENHGDVDLIVSSIDIDNPAFSTLSATPIIISPGTFENFTIRLDGMTEGVYNGNVTVTNNDLNEASFQFPIIGEILVESAAFVIKDGTDPSGTVIQDGQQEPLDLGQTPQYQDIVKTMTIENTGETDIVILNITSDNIRYTIPTIPGPISPGSFDTFTLQLDASITGIVEANILVTSNLGDYTFSVISEVLDLGINPPLTVYNAVTPNGDGRHDYLKIENIEGYSSNKVTIFTKTGNRVFEIENYSNNDSQNRFEGFSNMKNNRLLTEGNYYYIINYTTSDGQNKSISGFILLGL